MHSGDNKDGATLGAVLDLMDAASHSPQHRREVLLSKAVHSIEAQAHPAYHALQKLTRRGSGTAVSQPAARQAVKKVLQERENSRVAVICGVGAQVPDDESEGVTKTDIRCRPTWPPAV